EQSQGIAQVGDAVSQLDQVTQSNAALVEESAAAADSLKIQAAQLARTVAVFNLGSGHASRPAAAPPVRAAKARSTPTPALPASAPKVVIAPAASDAAPSDDWTTF